MSLAFDVHLRRGAFEAEVSVHTEARVLALTGPSGAGKTTILHGLAGLVRSERIRLAVDGQTIVDGVAGLEPPTHRRGVGYVFQDVRLFPHLTVAKNITFGHKPSGTAPSLADVLRLLDLEGFENRWPASLSGGEARRVAIARALCAGPRLLLLDEPFSGMDAERRDALIPYLLRLRDQAALPMILVSHDPRDIAAITQDTIEVRGGRIAL